MSDKLQIEVYQHDWIPGFAAFTTNWKLKKGANPHVALNLGSLISAVALGDIDKSEVPYFVAESIMHEVIHVLEDWAGVEFSEERVDALIQQYAKAAGRK